jgi:hypothetical protein
MGLALVALGVEALSAAPGTAPATPPEDPLVPESPNAVDRFWLMSISCSRLFTCTSWLMYSLGSVFAVGSWFCISVTSKVRKSFAEIVDELLLASLELSALLDPVAALAIGDAL